MDIIQMRPEKNQPHGFEVFASWIKKDSIMAEIGSYMGESAEVFLNSGNIKMLFCIDPWVGGYDNSDGTSFTDMNKVEKLFDYNMSKYNNYVKIKQSSLEAVKMFPDHFFDLVYIDGNHQYEAVLQDLRIWIPKIKPGGWCTGHDFGGFFSPVTNALLDYFKEMPWSLFNDTSWIYRL